MFAPLIAGCGLFVMIVAVMMVFCSALNHMDDY